METTKQVALIIEDDEDICLLLKQILKSKDFDSVDVQTLAKTRILIHEVNPSIIFVDHRLPDGLGLEFIPTLRQKFPEAIIVAMTAQHTIQNQVNAFINGVNHFLEKPFFITKIYELLSKVPK